MTKFTLYQIKDDPKVAHGIKFSGLEELEKYGLRDKLTLDIYKKVYEGEVEESRTSRQLETIYTLLQGKKPEGYTGHSVSVSDIVLMNGVYYYCDRYGWKAIEISGTPSTEDQEEAAADPLADMAIDDYLSLLDSDKDKACNILNHLLWYLQQEGVVDFHEDKLDELMNAPAY